MTGNAFDREPGTRNNVYDREPRTRNNVYDREPGTRSENFQGHDVRGHNEADTFPRPSDDFLTVCMLCVCGLWHL